MSVSYKMDTRNTTEHGEGNTITSPSIKRSRKYIFTLNNYTDTETQDIEEYFDKNCVKWIFGFEIGKCGTPHLQGFMEFKSAKKFSVLKTLCSRWHLQTARGSLKENYDYCSKDGNYRYGGFRPEKISWTCCIDHLYWWQEDIIKLLESKPDDRTIHWYWEPTGRSGKTTFQKHVVMNFENVLVLSGKASDMKNGIVEFQKGKKELPDIILVNIPRSNADYLSYTGLEEIKDMLFYSGKYEGGMVCGPCPHVICFANDIPVASKMSQDRWNVVRIT